LIKLWKTGRNYISVKSSFLRIEDGAKEVSTN